MMKLKRMTVKEYAAQEHKTEVTIRRWITEGKVPVIDPGDRPSPSDTVYAQKDIGGHN